MTPVLCLMNMVDIMELEDDDEYEGIVIVCQRFPDINRFLISF